MFLVVDVFLYIVSNGGYGGIGIPVSAKAMLLGVDRGVFDGVIHVPTT